MADGFTVDASEVTQLAADLGEVPKVAGRYIRAAVEVTARKIKDDWNENLYSEGHARLTSKSVDYDIAVGHGFAGGEFSWLRGEIGPNLTTKSHLQAAIAGLIEEGTVNNPPQGVGAAALERAEEDFERGLSKALEDAEKAALTDASAVRSAGAVMRGSY